MAKAIALKTLSHELSKQGLKFRALGVGGPSMESNAGVEPLWLCSGQELQRTEFGHVGEFAESGGAEFHHIYLLDEAVFQRRERGQVGRFGSGWKPGHGIGHCDMEGVAV